MARGQALSDHLAQHRGAAQTAAHENPDMNFLIAIPVQLQTDIVNLDGRAILFGSADGNLEFARQEGEFRMEGRPLAHQFAPGARILDLVRGHTGEFVGGDVAHAVAAGLDRVHLHLGQFVEDGGYLFQPWPVELDVLARGEVRIALVVVAGDPRQPAQLGGGDQPVGDADPQHGCEALDIEAVLQPQRAKLVFAQRPGQIAFGLAAELSNPFAYQGPIPVIVTIHADFAGDWGMAMVAAGPGGVKN